MARIAKGLIVHGADLPPIGVRQRPQPAGGIKGFVYNSPSSSMVSYPPTVVDEFPALPDSYTGFLYSFKRPSVDHVREYFNALLRMNRQRTDTHLHMVDRIELPDQIVGDDTDKPRC